VNDMFMLCNVRVVYMLILDALMYVRALFSESKPVFTTCYMIELMQKDIFRLNRKHCSS
jgi:hypothetical protein